MLNCISFKSLVLPIFQVFTLMLLAVNFSWNQILQIRQTWKVIPTSDFCVRGQLPFIQKCSVTVMYTLAVYMKLYIFFPCVSLFSLCTVFDIVSSKKVRFSRKVLLGDFVAYYKDSGIICLTLIVCQHPYSDL